MKKFLSFLVKRSTLYVIGAFAVIGVGGFLYVRSSTAKIETEVVHPADFLQQVSISGKVKAPEALDLTFAQSARVDSVNVKVGDAVTAGEVLAREDSGELNANLASAQASLDIQKVKLDQTVQGATAENISVSQTALTSAQGSLVNALRDAYVKAEDAVRNKTDVFFSNPNSGVPMITLPVDSNTEQNAFNQGRMQINQKLDAWKNISEQGTLLANYDTLSDSLDSIKSFIDSLNSLVTRFSPNGSGLTSAQISDDIALVNSAASEVSTASTNVSSAVHAVNSAQASLDLTTAPPTSSDLLLLQAQIKQAQASVDSIYAQLVEKEITAPIAGIVTVVNAKVGSIFGSNDTAISLIGADALQIESYVPEKNIPFIKVGDTAVATLDAYGDTPFSATVISIDPAETIRDGVSTYRVILQFTAKDGRIRSGMTANVLVTTDKRSGVITVPQGIVVEKDGQESVMVKNGSSFESRTVTTGAVSSLGNIEITSGLTDGDIVLLQPAN